MEIKEMKEVLAGIRLLGVTAKQVMKDGKIGVEDLAVLVPFLAQAETLVKAVQGLPLIKEEAKDLTMAEAQELIGELYGVVAAIKAA